MGKNNNSPLGKQDTASLLDASEIKQFEDFVVGPGDTYAGVRQPMDVKVGDHVLLDSYSGTELNLKGDKVKIVDEHSVMAILEEGDEE